jgi:hypothetical protein
MTEDENYLAIVCDSLLEAFAEQEVKVDIALTALIRVLCTIAEVNQIPKSLIHCAVDEEWREILEDANNSLKNSEEEV